MNHLNRLILAALLSLVAAVALAACGQDTGGGAPAATNSQTATSAETLQAAASPEQGAESESASESLRVISSRSASTASGSEASGSEPGSIGNFSLSPIPQMMPVKGGLTVSATGSVTVAADEAYVVIFPEQFYGPSGPEQMTAEDREEIIEKLAELDVPEEAIEFEGQGRLGFSSSISVEVDLGDLAEKSEPILDAVEEVIRRSESHGVHYSLSEENCERALSLARREAIPSAERAADDLAEALGVDRGIVIGALEHTQSNLTPYGYTSLAGLPAQSCGGSVLDPYFGLLPFGTEPEVEVAVGLQITYSIQ